MGSVAASIAGSVVSGAMSRSASKDASQTAERANALTQQQIAEQTKKNDEAYAGYQKTGDAASQRLSYYLGLMPDLSDPEILAAENAKAKAEYDAKYADRGAVQKDRSFLYRLAKREGKLPAYYELLASGQLDKSIPTSKKMKEALLRSTENKVFKPFEAMPQDGQYGSLLKKFSEQDLNNDVVYNTGLQFGLDQGTQAIDRMASARGGMESGATLKALTRYANDYGNTKANESYNRFNIDKNNTYSFLGGQQSLGFNATNNRMSLNNNLLTQSNNANLQTANNVGQNQMAGAAGVNNAIQSGLGNILYSQRTNNAPVVSGGYTGGYSTSMPGSSSPNPWYL